MSPTALAKKVEGVGMQPQLCKGDLLYKGKFIAPECVLDLEGSVVVSKVAHDPGKFL